MDALVGSTAISLPYAARFGEQRFELTEASSRRLSGIYFCEKTHNRFEVKVQYDSGSAEWFSVFAHQPYSGGSLELIGKDCSFVMVLDRDFRSVSFEFKNTPSLNFTWTSSTPAKKISQFAHDTFSVILLFDVSDLVYYIGHHDHLTGIQRVQACVLLGFINGCADQDRRYITYNNKTCEFIVIESAYFESLLVDLSRPIQSRKVIFDHEEARIGVLPNSTPIADALRDDPHIRLIVYLLGAAWVSRDYFHRILDLKRDHNACFCMTVHDLIPIFARETCDQGTATVFEEFLRKSFLYTDHFFTVSEYTALDLYRYASSLGRKNLPISVIENGHSFDEFFPLQAKRVRSPINTKFILFVSTIEGRKNHSYIFDVWRTLARTIKDLPVLVCVGRFGWRAESFLERMLVTGNLGNRIRVMSEVSDAQLEALYANCLFTVYPSIYEGWGLPVGESLSMGKICVTSDRSSIPEVAGEFGVFIDIDSVEDGANKIGRLIEDTTYRESIESRIRSEFKPRTWKTIANELISFVAQLPRRQSLNYPTALLGREYKLAQLPPRNLSALGYAMIAEVEGARKASITGYISRDEDLLDAQAMRFGPNWCSPEDWGTWSRYPECDKLFFIQPQSATNEVVIYEKFRVIAPLLGHTLRAVVNEGVTQEFRIDDEQMFIRVVGPIQTESDGTAEVRIHYEVRGPVDLTPILEKIDGRRLGIGFESMLVLDDSDLDARVAMLERVLFGGVVGQALLQGTSNSSSSYSAPIRASKTDVGGRSLLIHSKASLRLADAGDQRSLNVPEVNVGETVVFSEESKTQSLESVELLLGRGWFPLERGGVWSSGNEATLRFKLRATAEPTFVLSLEMRCLAQSSRVMSISIVINNVLLGSEQFRDDRFAFVRFVVDSTICPDDRAFVVLIHCDQPISPSQVEASSDTRKLGVQVRGFSIEPMKPLQLNRKYFLNDQSEIPGALASGWYPAESFGVWSNAEGGRIVGTVSYPVRQGQRNVRLAISGRVYGTDSTGAAHVDFLVQGQITASALFESDEIQIIKAIVPLVTLTNLDLLDVKIVRRGAVSPMEITGSEDRRKLGILISEILLENVDLASVGEESELLAE